MSAAAPEPKANMGQPAPRIDARAKVTGTARYGSDFPLANPAYAFLVTSDIARGRITGFDLAAAKAVPGVLEIFTHENVTEIKRARFFGQGGPSATSILPLEPQIYHDGQIVAMAVADTFEAAREAAYKVKVNYQAETPTATFDLPGTETKPAKEAKKSHEDPEVGDAEAALAAAEVKIDAEYYTPTQHHNPIELFTTSCAWSGDQLTIWEPSQYVYGLKAGVAQQLGIDPADVHVISHYVGGAFGSKGIMTPRTALVALAARRLNRPVKLVATRDQGFTIATYRAETKHRVKLGARKDGKLVAYTHEGWEVTSRPDDYLVGGTEDSVRMYAFENVWTKVHVVKADRNTPGFMRSPPEVPYIYALESAMDELAVKLNMDPVEFRRINDTQKDPIKGAPYTSRSLMQCFDEAARAFGWSKRNPQPGSMRDGDWLIGWGCAMATYPSQQGPATARVRMTQDGHVRVQIAVHDVGTGAYTVIGQMAAEKLGVDLNDVQVQLGDTDLPPGPVAGGSITTASACSVVAKACDMIREKMVQAALLAEGSPVAGRDPQTLHLSSNGLSAPDGAVMALDKVFEKLGVGALEEYAEWLPEGAKPEALKGLYNGNNAIVGGSNGDKMKFAFGAEFVEVRINARTREIRVPRMVGAFAAGRIMNTRTAHSQLMGGMIWGVSSALHEETELDKRAARYVNDNIAEYLIPVNADVPSVEIIMLSEEDSQVSPPGIKGLGELGNVGTAAAVANAVFHATGKRIRDLPIRIEDLLS